MGGYREAWANVRAVVLVNPQVLPQRTDLTELVEAYGWEVLADQVNIRCFMNDPTINSSLKFLRRTQWSRDRVEALYLEHLER